MSKLAELTPEERKELLQELDAQREKELAQKAETRSTYKSLVDQEVPEIFKGLMNVSKLLSQSKKHVFESFQTLLEMKVDAFGVKEGQQSHTFSTKDGSQSITIGFRVTDGWDDTVHAGVAKVNEFIGSLVTDENTQRLVNTINRLLRKDSNGNLKSSRVLEMNNIANDYNNDTLNDALDIIKKSYKPKRSCYYVEAASTDATGKKTHLPLSLSTVDFPEGTNINFFTDTEISKI